ncbi:7,8-dihydropterin-6-yl-methyl-4-(beta-D-ribofuranosyl)aminobenzene 5'-phosphate synthase [Serratia fonticola]|uniref:7, 8-dihydropterin-6-yl-methyl-4-(Beta-D-ribofuranosyl)aminobenzene 5'-phosphate synthase n=1 Tax=Serratia fonticola TaxID=47917 RepID=A0A542D2S1_SERFO|nr:MBL fold metallo-hydrolase [Serratia fonticola]TQI80622.1 7,8-dihydropterin-6-yl-methyl-4-(beta-D-ribofuranosyl)aminobenzene 5'-phosphate synthase [Serratia fonticola]TQI97353.1 7,8-dihydropterin-6-yl-methyl-4-(beta-D-ribofuranosyl)aminobenzene 5'-phosphate synthase [Serratia fonticola]TVZ71849.1 7,8-dihydropterin-6-yl-methyl-4-(beta-D-ribofuranosyl)aminobenzene 5'-phosphate synthase [Serratia fonticola]
MTLTIDVLLENRRSRGADNALIAKPGLSLLIQDESDAVLFDTGPDGSFLHNARVLGVNLDNLSATVLSHGHYDHSGGVPWLPDNTRIICHPGVKDERYAAVNIMGYVRKIKRLSPTVDYSRHAMVFTRAPLQISERFIWSGEIEVAAPKAYGIITGSTPSPDYVDDEGVLIYKSDRGLVIITGCGHRGVINIVRHCQNITGINRIYALIGGLHLRYASPQRLLKIQRFLSQIQPEQVMGCHCTGPWGQLWLPNTLSPATGDKIILP